MLYSSSTAAAVGCCCEPLSAADVGSSLSAELSQKCYLFIKMMLQQPLCRTASKPINKLFDCKSLND